MKFHNKTVILKSGRQIVIRLPEEGDAQQLIDLKLGYIKNATTLPLTVDEYPSDVESELDLINTYHISTNSILLIAEYNGELIGNIDITGNTRSKLFHTAMLGMGISENWRNQGLGGALIESAITWAKNDSILEIIWLDVYASNDLGYNLYKKMGFEVCGIIKGFFKEETGLIDKIQMYKRVG